MIETKGIRPLRMDTVTKQDKVKEAMSILCLIAYTYHLLIAYIIAIFIGHPVTTLDGGTLGALTSLYLGLGAMHSYDKKVGGSTDEPNT